ncbi:MAG: translation elongation factor [Actinomycetia bacterium]|jgi:elongation factor P|nr:translation elongation factor [Actinomycetes bacterium]
MSVSTNDLKNGMTLELDGTLFQVIEFQHVKPGKGGAFVRTKLRNVKTGAVADKTFNAGVKVGLAIVERKEMQYLYADGSDLVFMNLRTYEQVHVPGDIVGEATRYMTEGGQATVALHQGVPISVDLPASMTLAVAQTDPATKGDTRTNALKPATLETGTVVQVPLFVEEGDRVKVDTRSGEYIERVKA